MDNTIKQHQEMGYDRSVGMFSPDGLILQVEYAEKAVKLGATVLGIVTKEGVVFIGDRKITSNLLVKDSFKKVFEVDDHLGITGAGAMSDGRRLIEESQNIAQKHRVNYQNPMDTISLVKDIANIQQHFSQSGGLRPFGVALLVGGYENGSGLLYQTTPSGMFMQYLARSVGSLGDDINAKLEERYKKDMSNEEAIKLGLKVFKEVLTNEYDTARFDVGYVSESGFTRLDDNEIKKLG